MTVSLRIVDGPAGAPPDVSRIVATIGYAPGLAIDEIVQLDTSSAATLRSVLGYGIGVEAASRRRRISGVRGLLMSHNASTAGVVSAVTQTGLGPAMAVVATGAHPLDDASVVVRIQQGGAPGIATYQVSIGYNVISQGNVTPSFGPVLTMPPRAAATIVGTVDLTTLVYAKPATVTGTADVSDPTLYGAGGSLAGKTVILEVDGGGSNTYTFPSGSSALANLDALVAWLTANVSGLSIATYTTYPYLLLKGTDIGVNGEIDITGGTGLTLLGLSVATTAGTAGSLDGKTVILDEDTTTSQTLTFGVDNAAPTNASDVLTAFGTLTNISAALYSSRSLLSVASETLGASSSLAITGGNALALLGLTASVSPATGSEPSFVIDHLGVEATFAPGTYRAATIYQFTTRAPVPSASEVEARIRALDQAGADFGVVHIAANLSASDALTMAQALDALGAEFEGRAGNPRAPHFVIGVDPSELDAVVKATFVSFRSRRVDIAARGAYCDAGVVAGGTRALRSQSWPTADADALLQFHEDRGERRLSVLAQGFPGVYAITADENTATTKLVNATGMRFSVMVAQTPRIMQFSGGYSSADASSSFTDASIRNTTNVAFVAGYAALSYHENRTDLDTNSDGTLTDASADLVAVDIQAKVEAAIVPGGATAVQVTVDTATNFYTTRKLSGTIKFQNRVPAREVEFDIGPGLISEG